jgi:hypothetical protein
MKVKGIIYGFVLSAMAIILSGQPHWNASARNYIKMGQTAAVHEKNEKGDKKGQETAWDYRKKLNRLQPKQAYIVIDRYANRLSLRTEDAVLQEMSCSVGSGGQLIDTASGRKWEFETPSGVFHVTSKLVDPWWRKPDWAFIEENETIPKNERDRYDAEMMGEYALGFGNGYFIHGTIYERLLGVSVTHGCVRVGAEDLRKLYERVPVGTPIYIY